MWCSLARTVSFLTHTSLLCLLKSGTKLSPFFVALFHPLSPSELAMNKSLEHNNPCSPSPSFFCSIHLFLYPCVSATPFLWLTGEICEGNRCWNIYWSVSLSFIYFPLFPIALPSCLHRPRNTSSAVRRQRQEETLKIHNIKLLFSICCTQRFHLCKQKMRGAGVGWRLKMWGGKNSSINSKWNTNFGTDSAMRHLGLSTRFRTSICLTGLLTGNTDAALLFVCAEEVTAAGF